MSLFGGRLSAEAVLDSWRYSELPTTCLSNHGTFLLQGQQEEFPSAANGAYITSNHRNNCSITHANKSV